MLIFLVSPSHLTYDHLQLHQDPGDLVHVTVGVILLPPSHLRTFQSFVIMRYSCCYVKTFISIITKHKVLTKYSISPSIL